MIRAPGGECQRPSSWRRDSNSGSRGDGVTGFLRGGFFAERAGFSAGRRGGGAFMGSRWLRSGGNWRWMAGKIRGFAGEAVMKGK
jgi:hypothetical protein